MARRRGSRKVVSYRIPTSNHNIAIATPNPHQLYLIEFLHQTTTPGFIVVDIPYFMALSQSKKTARNSAEVDLMSLFCISKNKNNQLSEKFQLLRNLRFCPLAFAPKIQYIPILLVSHCENACRSCWRHRSANPFDMYLHILF